MSRLSQVIGEHFFAGRDGFRFATRGVHCVGQCEQRGGARGAAEMVEVDLSKDGEGLLKFLLARQDSRRGLDGSEFMWTVEACVSPVLLLAQALSQWCTVCVQ